MHTSFMLILSMRFSRGSFKSCLHTLNRLFIEYTHGEELFFIEIISFIREVLYLSTSGVEAYVEWV